ncbi:MAG: translation initiation factor IF-2 [Chloroflexota bacterium]
MAEEKQVVLIPDFLTVRDLAETIDASPLDVMKQLIANGIMASINQQIDFDTASLILEEMGFEAQSETAAAEAEERAKAAESQVWRQVYAQEKAADLETRPPVVTIMGHVDHGKTTLLDTIRKANVAEGEAGGITQHIGAYRAYHDKRQITFMDTPGHEAFTAMRARGAQGADVAILVVAADDGVMQTTEEAITHARAANVPMVVAITKVDKSNANPEIVKQGLAERGIVPDEWGGDTLFVPVAALQGDGIEELLEAVLLVADERKIVANPKSKPSGIVIESEMEKSRGPMVTLMILNGTLSRGDSILVGDTYGRIKAMFDESGKQVKEADPSTPVKVMGINDLPEPGEVFEWVKSEKEARSILDERDANETRQQQRSAPTLDDIFAQFQAGQAKELNLIVKADVQGSLQPITEGLESLETDGDDVINVNILDASIGNITENDVNLASTAGAIIIAFNVNVDNAAERAATSLGVEIRKYNVIYKLFESIQLALNGMLDPQYEERTIGRAEVRAIFRISRIGSIAGSYVLDGEIRRNAQARVLRNNAVIHENADVSSLKRVDDDVREVRAGFECGVGLSNFNDFEEGDIIEFYVTERVN